MALEPGFKLLERYTIQECLGKGGMSSVYKAFDTLKNKPCAIKEFYLGSPSEDDIQRSEDEDRTIQRKEVPGIDLSPRGDEVTPDDDLTRKRSKPRISTARRKQLTEKFKNEARILHEMDHPNLPKVEDYFVVGDYCYLVETYIEGMDLDKFLISSENQPVAEEKVRHWLRQILKALMYCHKRKVIHRDIKPANIIVTQENKAYLVDFGIARTFMAEKAAGLTRLFAPPEQYTGVADERSDVYALGATMYNLLTGTPPVEASERKDGAPLDIPSSRAPRVSPSADRLVMKALELDPHKRYQNAGAMYHAFNKTFEKTGATIALIVFLVSCGFFAWQYLPRIISQDQATISENKTSTLTLLSTKTTPTSLAVMESNQHQVVNHTPAFTKHISTPTIKPTATLKKTASSTASPILFTRTPIPSASSTSTLTSTPPVAWHQGKLVLVINVNGKHSLYQIDLRAGAEPELLYTPLGGEDFYMGAPVWSPDGKSIALSDYRKGTYIIKNQPNAQPEKLYSCDTPSWSPDSSQIICKDLESASFVIIDVATKNLVKKIKPASFIRLPTWSPNNNEIAYVFVNDKQYSLWRMGLDDGDLPVLLTREGSENYAPSWSPDGKWIAFQSNRGSSLSDLWILNRNGEEVRRLLNTPAEYWSRAPTWSPDGKWLAFVSNQAGGIGTEYGEVFAVSVATGEVHQVTKTGGLVYQWRISWGK